jgi:hypothetical protein
MRFAVSVEAGADPDPGQRLLALEPLADQAQDRHLPLGPLDPPDALGGETEIGHVVGRQARGRWRGGGRRGRGVGHEVSSPCG